MKRTLTMIASLLLLMSVAIPAIAQGPITINYVTFVPRMHAIAKVLAEDLKAISDKSGGRIVFNYRGGPESMKVPAMGMGVKTGAVDMICISPDFYEQMVKGLDALSGSTVPVPKHREIGLYDYLNSLFNPIGIQYLMMVPMTQGDKFHFYTKKPIKKVADFKGLSLSGTGIFDDIGPALGMVPVAMEMGEQYTGMERGVISVCRGGLDSVMAYKFYEVAKYIVNPGFGTAPASLFMNLEKWKSLPKDLQDYLLTSLYGMASATEKKHDALDQGALKAALGNGMQVVEIEDKDLFQKSIYDALYRRGVRSSPQTTEKLWKMIHK
ncbi:MAG: TRAP transporter substrate-binding protein DctP [Deltaproteobacteria bacterium]|nr:TRAP transporter substrate-binding protein DctP [Deltaproteobacteria bacterium]